MAASKSHAQKAWDVSLSADKKETFAHWLVRAINDAISARSVSPGQNEYWWTLYEQGRTRESSSMPWQDAADLTSYIITEKVDALRARVMRTIFVDPVYTVEGWGESAQKAPFVEDFHQWAVESEGLQTFLTRAIQASLIETRGVLEVYEDTTVRKVRKPMKALLAPSQLGAPFQMDQDLEPVLARDQNGEIIEATDLDVASGGATADIIVDSEERVRKGPGYRVLPYRDFLVLPGHAKEKADIWGYAKRITKRWDVLKEDAERGMYDKNAVEELHDSNEITSEQSLSGTPEPVADQRDDKAEKELWEVQLLHNVDGKGLRWYIATVHLPTYTVLRLVHEDKSVHRFILFVPFPRTDKSHEGYSFAGHKLITIAEEHTAWRNMLADRASMEISAPVKRMVGALWDPDLQPFGPKAVIDVRDMKEIDVIQLPHAMQGAIQREQEIVQASERVAGINDVALGQAPDHQQTLGEVNLVAEQSFVRMDEVIKNIQEALEDLGQARHAIWLNCVKEYGEAGMPMPMGLSAPHAPTNPQTPGLDQRGGQVDTSTITPEKLEGTFRFKPRGSTENADITKQRSDFIQFMQALPLMMQAWPAMMQMISMNQEAAKSTLEQALRLFRMPDKQAWLNPPQPTMGMMPPRMGMPGMPPIGGPPATGAPPMPPQGAPPNG